MNKCLAALFMIAISGLMSCSKSEHYYKSHPKELQQAIKACPQNQPQGLSCQQLEDIASRMNQLAYELQLSPQAFGKKILSLQETLANEQEKQKTEGANANLQTSLTQIKLDLADHLAVVRWFESPAS